eukprot:Sro231_g093730.2  (207) ;mRNA; f:80152-80772
MVQGLQAKCPDHSTIKKKGSPASTVITTSSDGTGTYTRNQRMQEAFEGRRHSSSGTGNNTRYVSMTVNQYSKSVPNAGGTPSLKTAPAPSPATAPAKPPKIQFQHVSEVIPFSHEQNHRVGEKQATIPARGPFKDPYAQFSQKQKTPQFHNPYRTSAANSNANPPSFTQQMPPLSQAKSDRDGTNFGSTQFHSQNENSPPNGQVDV